MTLHTTTDTDREHMRDEADRKRVHDALDTLERLADTEGAWTPDEAVAALDAAETAFERTKGSAYEAGAAVALGMISRRVLDVLVSEHKERARLARREGPLRRTHAWLSRPDYGELYLRPGHTDPDTGEMVEPLRRD